MPARALLLGLFLSMALLGGCGHRASNTPVATTSQPQTAAAPEHDPCALLDPKEVEGVLGASLAVAPFQLSASGAPHENDENCRYEDASFHTIDVEVTWSDAATVWKMFGVLQSAVDKGAKGMLHLADGSDIAGEWDEARVLNCCRFMALRGDQMVTVDIGGTTAVTIPQAAKLADAALKRLDKPLSIDGSKGVDPALSYATAHRPKHIDPCALLSRTEAEALMGPLTGEPQSKGDTCTYPRPPEGRISMDVELKVEWSTGFSKFREQNTMINNFAKGFSAGIGGLSAQETKGVEKTISGPDPTANPAWEASGPSVARGYQAVKKDVLITVDTLGLKHDDVLKVLAQAMSKI